MKLYYHIIKSIFLCLGIVLFVACFKAEQQTKNTLLLGRENSNQETTHFFNDIVFNQIVLYKSDWINSWSWQKNNFKKDYFSLNVIDTIKINWIDFNIDDHSFIKQYDSLFISSSKYDIDMYSYNTFFERKDNLLFVEFDVDSKIYLIDKINNKRAELIGTGSYERIEDSFWVSDMEFVLLGYIQEEEKKPFVWIVNLQKDITIFRYISVKSFKIRRDNYFLIKYPNVKLK